MVFISLFYTLFYSTACLLFGLIFLKVLSPEKNLEEHYPLYTVIASGFLLGQGVLAQIWLLLGLGALFKTSLIWGLLILITVAGVVFCKSLFNQLTIYLRNSILHVLSLSLLWKLIFLSVTAVILLFGLKSFVVPPAGDPEGFYMVLPKIMASSERLAPQPNFHSFSQIGFSGEMHFAALMSIASPNAAKLFVWITSMALAAILLALCAESGVSFRGYSIALILLFTSVTFTSYITDGNIIIFACAFGLSSYYWALKGTRKSPASVYILAGLFAGFSIISKLSYLIVIPVGIFLIIVWNHLFRDVDENESLKDRLMRINFVLLIIGLSAFIAISPHFIKNYILFREPFAPLWMLKSTGGMLKETVKFSPDIRNYLLLTYPLQLVHGRHGAQGGSMSALILAFLPLSIFLKRKDNLLKSTLFQISIIACISVLTWVLVRPTYLYPRLFLATLLLFIPLAALSAENLFISVEKYKILKFIVVFSLFFSLVPVMIRFFPLTRLFDSAKDRQCALASPYCTPLLFLNDTASMGDRIFFGGYFTYFLRPDLLQCISSSDEQIYYRTLQTQEDKWEYLYKRGFKYLLIQKNTHNNILQSLFTEAQPEWVKIDMIYKDDGTVLFSISLHESGRNKECECRQIHSPAWDVVNNRNTK